MMLRLLIAALAVTTAAGTDLFKAMTATDACGIDDCEGDDCHPKCQWKCDSPVCNQICEPVCEPPKCSTRCQVRCGCRVFEDVFWLRTVCGLHVPAITESHFVCVSVLVSASLEYLQELGCSKCMIKCNRPECEVRCPVKHCEKGRCPKCETVCRDPICHTECANPEPKCEAVCENPVCDWRCHR